MLYQNPQEKVQHVPQSGACQKLQSMGHGPGTLKPEDHREPHAPHISLARTDPKLIILNTVESQTPANHHYSTTG